jgi:hypothetical protein
MIEGFFAYFSFDSSLILCDPNDLSEPPNDPPGAEPVEVDEEKRN